MGRTESAAIPLAAHCERDSGRWESNYFPVCRTVKVSPATAIVPVRDVVPVGRAATSYPRFPGTNRDPRSIADRGPATTCRGGHRDLRRAARAVVFNRSRIDGERTEA